MYIRWKSTETETETGCDSDLQTANITHHKQVSSIVRVKIIISVDL